MTEERGEIAACVTKVRPTAELAEEIADLLILLVGTGIAADHDLNRAFWHEMEAIMSGKSKMIAGRIPVSEFRGRIRRDRCREVLPKAGYIGPHKPKSIVGAASVRGSSSP